MINTPFLNALKPQENVTVAAVESAQFPLAYIQHADQEARYDIALETSLEGFNDFFGGIGKQLKQLSIRCSAWFRLRPPLTDWRKLKQHVERTDAKFVNLWGMEVPAPYGQNCKSNVAVARFEERKVILQKLVKHVIPAALRRYGDYLNRIDKLANSLPDTSLFAEFPFDYQEEITKDSAVFDTNKRSGYAEIGDLFESFGDIYNIEKQVDEINTDLARIKPTSVKRDVDRLAGLLDTLYRKTQGSELTEKWKEVLVNDIQALAEWVEYYAITQHQLTSFTTALVQTNAVIKKQTS